LPQALQLQQLLESCADEAEAGRLRAELAQRQVRRRGAPAVALFVAWLWRGRCRRAPDIGI
jgi:hypothetical protein